MWETTGRCLLTWLKITIVLGVLVAGTGWVWGWHSSPLALAVIAAILVELLTIRGLLRWWAFEASGNWWWF